MSAFTNFTMNLGVKVSPDGSINSQEYLTGQALRLQENIAKLRADGASDSEILSVQNRYYDVAQRVALATTLGGESGSFTEQDLTRARNVIEEANGPQIGNDTSVTVISDAGVATTVDRSTIHGYRSNPEHGKIWDSVAKNPVGAAPTTTPDGDPYGRVKDDTGTYELVPDDDPRLNGAPSNWLRTGGAATEKPDAPETDLGIEQPPAALSVAESGFDAPDLGIEPPEGLSVSDARIEMPEVSDSLSSSFGAMLADKGVKTSGFGGLSESMTSGLADLSPQSFDFSGIGDLGAGVIKA